MASMTFSNVTSTSFTAEVTDLDTSYARDDRSVDWYLGSTQVSSSSLSAHASSASCSFSGLTPNTDYTVKASIRWSSTPTSGLDRTTIISGRHMTKPGAIPPDPKPERPGYFYWDTAKTSGAKFNLTASEWNRLISNVIGQFYLEFVDKVLTMLLLFAALCFKNRKRKKKGNAGPLTAGTMAVVLILLMVCQPVNAAEAKRADGKTGDDLRNYVQTIYNGDNGLPSGEANTIAQTKDGVLWIGNYGGL